MGSEQQHHRPATSPAPGADEASCDELVDLVDHLDRPVGTRRRSELVDAVDRWRAVSLVVCSPWGPRVLLARRAATKRHDPSRWAPCVAGTVAAGETYLDTVVREAREEMSLWLDPGELCELHRGEWDSPGHLRMMGVYLVHRDVDMAEAVWDRSEADMLRWFDLDEVCERTLREPGSFATGLGRMLAMTSAHLAKG